MSDEVKQNRLLSLDVFRGITIAGMVLVNNPGTWSAIYPPLEHAEWHGATPTDLVFPFFLFIVGIAITLALGKRVESGAIKKDIYLKIVRRAAIIFALGLFLAAFPFYNFTKEAWLDVSTLRIMGVLQRIAVCYLVTALIFIHTNWKQQAIIAGALLLVYWALMTLINVPGCEITTIDDKGCNFAAFIDRTILTENHIWKQSKIFDPEGLLSTTSGNRDDSRRSFMRSLAAARQKRLRKSFRAVLFRRGSNRARLDLEFLVSAQQSTLDEFVCSLYGGFGFVISRILLLAD